MKINKKIIRPWIDKNGDLFSDKKIEELGQSWDLETWDQYLKETVEVGLKEQLVNPRKYDLMRENPSYNDLSGSKSQPHGAGTLSRKTRNQIHLMKQALSRRDRYIVHYFFWEGLSTSDIAFLLKMKSQIVRKRKKQILKKFKRLLEKQGPFFPRVRARTQNLSLTEPSKEKQIKQVFLEETRRR